MARLTTAAAVAAALATTMVAAVPGCGGGGAKEQSSVVHPAGPPAGAVLPQDQTFAVPDIDVEGVAFAPEAIGLPSMPQAISRSRTTLERQRKKVSRKNPSPDDVHVLVTLLWNQADQTAATDPAKARALRAEAQKALGALRAARGDKTGDVTLEMLAAADQWLADPTGAIDAYKALIARFPQHKGIHAFQTWLAHLYLRQHRVADAVALVADWKPAELDELSSYVLAWVSFASGQAQSARAAIVQALEKWKDASTRPVLERDLVLILARTATPVDQAGRLIAQAVGEDQTQAQARYVLTFKLSEAYRFAGHYQEASSALDSIVNDLVKGEMPANDLVGFRFRQADYAFRLGQPDKAATAAIEAHKALAACADKCAGATAQAVTERVLKLAQFAHTVFAKSQDPRYYAAAQKLYTYYLTIPGRPDTDTARGYLKSLEQTKASADPAAGKHDPEVMHNLILARREQLAACYEAGLVADPKLAGDVKLTIEVDQKGAVAGVSSEPAAGTDGMAKVAGCAVERARAWVFPARTVPGKTSMMVPAVFHRQEPAKPAPPAQPAQPAGAG